MAQRYTIFNKSQISIDAPSVRAWNTTADANPGALPDTGPKIRVIRTVEGMEEIRHAWMAWKGHRDADIDVCETLLRCSPEEKPYIILVERNGQPDAILIGRLSTTTLTERIAYMTFPTSRVRVLSFVYGGFLGNQSEENSKLIVNALEKSLRRREADVAILNYVREDGSLYQLATHVRSALMRGRVPASQLHWMLDVPESADEIFAEISREHRRKLRAEAKKFRTAFPDLEIVRFPGGDRLEELITAAEQVAATTYQRALGAGFSDTRVIRELITLEAMRGWLRGYVLYVGSRPCAFWIGCAYNRVFLSEYLAHDPAYAKYSPGTFLLMQIIEEICRDDVIAIDFGIGDALYKRRFSNRHWVENTVYLYGPTWTGMRVKALRTMAVFIETTGKSLLGTKLSGRIKKLWRSRLAAAASQR